MLPRIWGQYRFDLKSGNCYKFANEKITPAEPAGPRPQFRNYGITEQTAIMVIGVHTLTQPGWSHIFIERHSPGYIWEDLLFKNY